MKIINNIKKYKIVYLALVASLCLTAGPISEMLKTEPKSDIKTRLRNNIIVKSVYNFVTKINAYAKTKISKKAKEKSKSDIIIDATTKAITIELKQSTSDIVKILDTTVADGKLKLGKGLKLRSQCKKKISETTNQLEEIINETVEKLETKDENKNLLIKNNTEAFIEETKKEVSDIQKSMSTEMRKALGKKPEVVFDCTDKAKNQIAEFEDKVIAKIEEFSDKLKQDVA